MKQINWFDRKFDFSSPQNIFPAIIERLEGTSVRLGHKTSSLPVEQLTKKWSGSWSIQEHIGHLTDLEPLWQGRLEDILLGREELRWADLENKKTDLAGHNETDVTILLTQFRELRHQTLAHLKNLTENEVYKFALHPRLKTPMRTMDLFLFVAEHDDHHLAKMSELQALFTAENKRK
jgi:uncharacterized damage-inducible protein DinB